MTDALREMVSTRPRVVVSNTNTDCPDATYRRVPLGFTTSPLGAPDGRAIAGRISVLLAVKTRTVFCTWSDT